MAALHGGPPLADDAACRICFAGAGEGGVSGSEANPELQKLVSPCRCEGSQKYVHLGCLRRWQRSVQLGGSNHPEDRAAEDRHLICNVCKSRFDLPPQDRASMMAELAGVQPHMVVPGVLLVTTRTQAQSSSPDAAGLNLALRAYVECKAAHFREAVYVLTEVRPALERGDGGSDVVLGVNLSRRLQSVPKFSVLEGTVDEATLREHERQGVEVVWMNGGPVEPRTVTAMFCVTRMAPEQRAQALARFPGVRELVSDPAGGDQALIHGSMHGVLACAAEEIRHGARSAVVLAWAGFAQWSRAQLLGEMARGSWGWCTATPADVTAATVAAQWQQEQGSPGAGSPASTRRPCQRESRPPPEALWNSLRYSSRLAWTPENELSRDFARNFPVPLGPDPQAAAVAALAQQFEALRRGSMEPTGASLRPGAAAALATARPRVPMRQAEADVQRLAIQGDSAGASEAPVEGASGLVGPRVQACTLQ